MWKRWAHYKASTFFLQGLIYSITTGKISFPLKLLHCVCSRNHGWGRALHRQNYKVGKSYNCSLCSLPTILNEISFSGLKKNEHINPMHWRVSAPHRPRNIWSFVLPGWNSLKFRNFREPRKVLEAMFYGESRALNLLQNIFPKGQALSKVCKGDGLGI